MNLFQKRAALLKIAQVKSAMRHVLRGRMAKQAGGIDINNPQGSPLTGNAVRDYQYSPGLPLDGDPNLKFTVDPSKVPDMIPPYKMDEKKMFSVKSPFKDNPESQINGVTNPSVPGNTFLEKLDNLNFNRDARGVSNSPLPIPQFIPEWFQRTGRMLDEAPWQREGSMGGVPDFGDMSEFNVKDRTMLGEQPSYASPYIEDAVRQSAMKAKWQDIRKRAIQEAQNYYKINGIPREKINDKEYRDRVGRIIERLAAKDMKAEPGAYPRTYNPYDPRWTD